VIVDDGSIDGTVEYLQRYSCEPHPFSVQAIFRASQHGPANAELVGCQASSSEWLVKMDADGQHPVALLDDLVQGKGNGSELIIASRYVDGGANHWRPFRGIVSRSAKALAAILLRGARHVQDPVSGYFMVKRNLITDLNPDFCRYKLLLYILATHPDARVREVPLVMRDRGDGVSKITTRSMNYVPLYLVELLGYFKQSRRPVSIPGGPSSPTATEKADAT